MHLGDLPVALKSSSGGCTPVRQLKKRAAQRRKGSMPFFTLSATELPDTSGIILTSKAQNDVSKMEFLLVLSRAAILSLTQLKIAKLAVINNLILNLTLEWMVNLSLWVGKNAEEAFIFLENRFQQKQESTNKNQLPRTDWFLILCLFCLNQ